MHLSLHSDYSLRVLMFLTLRGDAKASIDEIATAFDISANHLVKVVHNLSKLGFIETSRGRGGGMRLARRPEAIRVGDVVRQTESLDIIECFDKATNTCRIARICALRGALAEATGAFLATLDGYTLADITRNTQALARRLES